MKIARRLRKVQFGSAHNKLTSFAGLKLVTDLAHRLGVLKGLETVTVKKRRRGIPMPDFVMSLVHTLIAGGSNYADVSVLRDEQATRELLYDLEVPAPTTVGERLRTFTLGHILQLEAVCARSLAKVARAAGLCGPATLDVDSSIFEVHGYFKEGARYGYTGEKGLHPLLAFWAETRCLLGVRLRAGNRHTGDGAVSFLRECLSRLPRVAAIVLRMDSGFYSRHVVAFAEAHRLGFSISAKLTSALLERISARPEAAWQAYPWEEEAEWTEFPYQPTGWKDPYRLLVKRAPYYEGPQRVLGQFFYTAVITNRRGAGASLLRHHLARGGAENYIEEWKNGFGARRLPNQKFMANWAWLAIAMLAYNLVQSFKLLVLPGHEQSDQIKALRLHWFCIAAQIVRTGRRVKLALARGPEAVRRFHFAQTVIQGL